MREIILGVFAILALCGWAQAQQARDLRVGHWIRAKGALEGPGVFVAGEMELLQPDSSESLTGTAGEAPREGAFTMLGIVVEVDEKTTWEGVGARSIVGKRVKISGRLRPDGRFRARRVSVRDPGRDRVEGRVDAIEVLDGQLDLRVQDFVVRVAASSKLELEAPLASLRLAPPRAQTLETPRRDEDDRVRGSIRLGEDWVLGGLVEWDGESRGNFDLDSSRPRDRVEHELALRTELVWTPGERALFLASYEHLEDWRSEQTKPSLHEGQGQFKQLYGYFSDALFGWDLQLGRAEYHEARRWIHQADLDGVRLLNKWRGLEFDFSVTTKLQDGSDRDESTTNVMAFVNGGTSRRGWALWVLDRDDRDASGESARHFGARMHGEWLPEFDLWADVSALRGELAAKRVSGEGLDVGAVWSPMFLGPLSLIGGYAFATGDSSPADANSSTFRQTGFHDNKGKLASATSLHYYGELVDPELANLGIFTLGIGLELEKRTTLTLLAHRYTLDRAEDALYGSNLRATPDGVHAEIGWEYDLVLGTKRWSSWQFEFVLGMFDPGPAFPAGDRAFLGAVQAKYRF